MQVEENQENEESFDEILAKLPLSQAEAAMEVFSEVFPHENIGIGKSLSEALIFASTI